MSLIDFEKWLPYDIDFAYFPNAVGKNLRADYYSSLPYAVTTSSLDFDSSWFYDFRYSKVWIRDRSIRRTVRLVHSNQ
jgi:hypothetical protein